MATKKIAVGMTGRFKMIAHKPDGSSRIVADWFDNLILDSGLERLAYGGVLSHCHVGSDSTTPVVTQTSLVSKVAHTTTVNFADRNVEVGLTYAWVRKTYRFGVGAAAGNLSEVGVGWSDTELFSRALIRDDLGDPTTITILSDEVLDVIYEARMYPNLSDQTFTVDIAGVDYTFTLRPVCMQGPAPSGISTQWSERFDNFLSSGFVSARDTGHNSQMHAHGNGATLAGLAAGELTGTILSWFNTGGAFTDFREAYVTNSLERKLRQTYDLNAGNAAFGGFTLYSGPGAWQMVVSPNIPKDNTKVMTLDFTVSWGRKT